MDWSDNDLNMRFLLAKPIELKTIGVLQPLTIDKIINIGFSVYNQHLSMLCMSSDDICAMLNVDNATINPFDFIINNCTYGNE